MPKSKPGRKRVTGKTKGRQLDDAAMAEVQVLLGDRPLHRDLLIEHLHLVQDKFGCLQAKHIRALAEKMRLSQVEVYEVASFYDHFDVVKEGEAVPAPLTIRVCDSVACMMAGAEALISNLEAGADQKEIRIMRAPCMGGCDVAPAARVGDKEVGHATVEGLLALAEKGDVDALSPEYQSLAAYQKDGGYGVWEKVKSGVLSADAIIDKLSDAGLRGLGGAGFPTGKKWSFVRAYEGPRLMTINGDEGEPGTFKDRYYL
ncbi:MAG: NAD(P)H-dependent oxidoreductase subunit E, partial [Rhizobiaceae bacterium]